MIVAGLATADTTWFLAVAVAVLAAVFGRVVGLTVDGFDTHNVPPIVVELAIASVMIWAHMAG